MRALVQVSSQAAVARGAAEDARSLAGMQAGGHAHSSKIPALACMDLCMTHTHSEKIPSTQKDVVSATCHQDLSVNLGFVSLMLSVGCCRRCN